MLIDRMDYSRIVLALILAVSLAALAAAFAGQYLVGLEPCVLCLWQRVPFAAAAVIAGIGLLAPVAGGQSLLLAGLTAVIFALGGALAFYHVGVQQHWWSSLAGCGGVAASAAPLTVTRVISARVPSPTAPR